MRRVKALDGLRGSAILCVVGRHLFEFKQGWIGVDIFFVLSGYLITTSLLAERGEPHFWKIFYTRRAARILPAFVLLLLSTVLGLADWKLLWPWVLCFAANEGVLRHPLAMEAAGFGVLWSLAVEEHFYFLWPLQIRRLSRATLIALLLAVIAVEPVLRLLATLRFGYWRFTYMFTPLRLDGLAIGALLALLMEQRSVRERLRPWIAPVAIFSLAASAVSWSWLDNVNRMLFCDVAGYLVVELTTASALAYFVLFPQSFLARLLAWSPLAWLGRISYGVYLFHEVVATATIHWGATHGHLNGPLIGKLTFPITLLLAWLSYRFYEQPAIQWGRRRIAWYREQRVEVAAGC